MSQIESAGDVNVANLSGVRCDRRPPDRRPGTADTRLFLRERSLWRPKTCLCQIYMIFDRRRVGVINLNSDRNVTVIHIMVTVCLLRRHQTGNLKPEGFYLRFVSHQKEICHAEIIKTVKVVTVNKYY